MSETKKTYSLEEVADKVNFNKAFVKVVMKQLFIDPEKPITEKEAAKIASRLKRPWPPPLNE